MELLRARLYVPELVYYLLPRLCIVGGVAAALTSWTGALLGGGAFLYGAWVIWQRLASPE